MNSMAAEVLSNLLEHPSIVHFQMSNFDFTYQVLSSLRVINFFKTLFRKLKNPKEINASFI